MSSACWRRLVWARGEEVMVPMLWFGWPLRLLVLFGVFAAVALQ